MVYAGVRAYVIMCVIGCVCVCVLLTVYMRYCVFEYVIVCLHVLCGVSV